MNELDSDSKYIWNLIFILKDTIHFNYDLKVIYQFLIEIKIYDRFL